MARTKWVVGLVGATAALGASWPSRALAVGESVNGFPNWTERVIHEWMNRARSDPQLEMTACGSSKCGEGACYSPVGPLWYSEALNHAARFHSAEMSKQSFFAHDSACTLVSNIATLFPGSCDGSASCACVGGVKACSPTCTAWNARVKLFGPTASGEIIASGTDPNGAFYQWLYETSAPTTCAYSSANGHRWLILKSTGSVGTGSAGPSVGDFSGGGSAYKIPSGSHYPRQSASVEAWANWYDTAGPKQALVNVDGACQPMTLTRGSQTNGAWKATLTNVSTGCHRYYFVFADSTNATISYPSTGSLGIGPAGSCEDWNSTRPAMGTGCGACVPSCNGKSCGSDGCTGTCGTCGANQSCQSGQCVPSGTGGTGGTGGTSTGGTGGTSTGGTGGTSTGGSGGTSTGGSGGTSTGGTGGTSAGGAGGTLTGGAAGAGGTATGGGGAAGAAAAGGSAGIAGSGGAAGSGIGGSTSAGGSTGAGGGSATGGGTGSGGTLASGGTNAGGLAGSSDAGLDADGSRVEGGCACSAPGGTPREVVAWGLVALGLALARRRRR